MSAQHTSTARDLPFDVIHQILNEVWQDTTSLRHAVVIRDVEPLRAAYHRARPSRALYGKSNPIQRWQDTTGSPVITRRRELYHGLLAVPALHEIIVSIASIRPYFRFGSDGKDLDLHRTILDDARSFAIPGGKDVDNSFSDRLSRCTHAVFDLQNLDKGYEPISRDLKLKKSWECYMRAVYSLLPDCVSITVVSTVFLHLRVAPFLHDALASFHSLVNLFFDCELVANYFEFETWMPMIPAVPSVRFLRLRTYPSCSGDNRTVLPRGCACENLLKAFPGIQHLHLDVPVFLKFLDPPDCLDTVTLTALPRLSSKGLPCKFSVLHEHGIIAAVRRGFMQRTSSDTKSGCTSRTIVIMTGKEVHGLEAVQSVCDEHGITLKREVVY